MPRLTRILILVAAVSSAPTAAPTAARAQGNAMTELYGAAVHSYYSHDYTMAQQLLSQVVESGSLDPRAHYFLGLTQEVQGGDGTADFEAGARLEAEGRLVVNVGQALMRIQGSVRGKIEKARRMARVQMRSEQLAAQALRRKTIPKPDPNVAPASATTEDPFAEGMTSADKKPAAAAGAPVTPPAAGDAASDPFADDPEPNAGDPFAPTADAPAADDPFAPAAGADDPFAPTTGDAADDPFKF